MQLTMVKTVLATVWVSAVLIAGLAGNLNSLSNWTVLAGFAICPPIVMMWWWTAPAQALAESIQEVRR